MSDEEFENYLALLTGLLKMSRSQREALGRELKSHLEERHQELMAQGYSPSDAVRGALEEFGDVVGLARHFTVVDRYRKRRKIMRATFGSLVGLALMAVLFVVFSPGRHGQVELVAEDDLLPLENTSEESSVQSNDLGDPTEGSAASHPENREMEKHAASVPDDHDRSALVAAKLEGIGDFHYDEVALREVVTDIAQRLDINMMLDRRALDEVGVSPDTPIAIHLVGVPTRLCLELMLRQYDLAYYIHGGVLIVTTVDAVHTEMYARVYNVANLLEPINSSRKEEVQSLYANRIERLKECIRDSIHPDDWTSSKGDASIDFYRGALVIRATGEMHRKVEALLKSLEAVVSTNPDHWDAHPSAPQSTGSVTAEPTQSAPK